MKDTIETLYKDTPILLHESRIAQHEDISWILHFMLCQNEKKQVAFTMAYEHFTAKKPIYNHGEKEKYGYLIQSGILTRLECDKLLEQINTRLGSEAPLNVVSKKQVGSLQDILSTGSEASDPLSDYSVQPTDTGHAIIDKTTAPQTRQVEEMINNSIYAEDDQVKHETYLDSQPEAVVAHISTQENLDVIEPATREKKTSIFNSNLHFKKSRIIPVSEFIALLTQYQDYINKVVPVNLQTEDPFYQDMESMFGLSFDIEQLKSKLFRKKDDDDHFDYGTEKVNLNDLSA